MKFVKLTEEEIKKSFLIPEGQYSAEVLRTDEKTDKNGEIYFNLKIRVNLGGMKEKTKYDLIYFNGNRFYKFKHFCESSGLQDKYNAEEIFPIDCDGKKCTVLIKHRTNKEGLIEDYIKDYIKSNEIDQDMPF